MGTEGFIFEFFIVLKSLFLITFYVIRVLYLKKSSFVVAFEISYLRILNNTALK